MLQVTERSFVKQCIATVTCFPRPLDPRLATLR